MSLNEQLTPAFIATLTATSFGYIANSGKLGKPLENFCKNNRLTGANLAITAAFASLAYTFIEHQLKQIPFFADVDQNRYNLKIKIVAVLIMTVLLPPIVNIHLQK